MRSQIFPDVGERAEELYLIVAVFIGHRKRPPFGVAFNCPADIVFKAPGIMNQYKLILGLGSVTFNCS